MIKVVIDMIVITIIIEIEVLPILGAKIEMIIAVTIVVILEMKIEGKFINLIYL